MNDESLDEFQFKKFTFREMTYSEYMQKILIGVFIVFMLYIPGACSPKGRHNTKVIKPKYHHSWFNHKKDKRVKRTKSVKVVS